MGPWPATVDLAVCIQHSRGTWARSGMLPSYLLTAKSKQVCEVPSSLDRPIMIPHPR